MKVTDPKYSFKIVGKQSRTKGEVFSIDIDDSMKEVKGMRIKYSKEVDILLISLREGKPVDSIKHIDPSSFAPFIHHSCPPPAGVQGVVAHPPCGTVTTVPYSLTT